MGQAPTASRAALGLTVKSGWAAAVLLSGSPSSPHALDSRTIALSDPAIPEARQPYHAGFATARPTGPELSRLLSGVQRFGTGAVARLIRDHLAAGHRLTGVGVVSGSLIDPAHVASGHIRIHALEGQLFRSVVEEACATSNLPCSVWRNRDLLTAAGGALRHSEREVRSAVTALGRTVGGPWRAEQKAAAVAAWLVLAARTSGRPLTRNEASTV